MTASNAFVAPTRVFLRATFTKVIAGVVTLVDPTTLILEVQAKISRASVAPTVVYRYGVDVALVRDSAGKYSFELLLDKPGTWNYRWTSSGATQEGVVEGQVVATARTF